MNSESTLEHIRNQMRLFHRGDREEARAELTALWEELSPEGDAYHRSVLAHYLADMMEDAGEELAWDLRALEMAESQPEEPGDPSASAVAIQAFLPSLHLNLADDYRKMGDFDKARLHTERGMERSGGLGLDAYGQTVRAGLIRVQTQIDEHDSGPAVIFDMD